MLSLAEADGPVTLAELMDAHPGIDSADVGRCVLRLAVTGLAEMRRVGRTLQA